MKPVLLLAVSVLSSVVPLNAGEVKAQVKGGTLRVTSKGGAVAFSIVGAPGGAMAVTPEAGTTVNGVAVTVDLGPIANDVRVQLAGAANQVAISGEFPRDLVLDLGNPSAAGAECVASNVDVARNLAITGSGALGAVTLTDSAIHGRTKVKFGTSTSTCTWNGDTFGDQVAFTASGTQTVSMNDGKFDGELRFKHKGNASSVLLDTCEIDGKLTVSSKANSSAWSLVDNSWLKGALSSRTRSTGGSSASIADSTVDGEVSLTGGKGDDQVDIDVVTFAHSVRATLAAGDDTITVFKTEMDSFSPNLGQGANHFAFDKPHVLSSLRLTGESGADDILVTNGSILNDVDMKLGGGNNVLHFTTIFVAHDFALTCGNGDDLVDLTGTTITDTKSVDTGGGNDTIL